MAFVCYPVQKSYAEGYFLLATNIRMWLCSRTYRIAGVCYAIHNSYTVGFLIDKNNLKSTYVVALSEI